MAFPNSFSGTILLKSLEDKNENFEYLKLLHLACNENDAFSPCTFDWQENRLIIETQNSLFRYKYKIQIDIEKQDIAKLNYEVETFTLSTIIFVISLFISLLSRFPFIWLIFFNIGFLTLAYWLNIWYIQSLLRKFLSGFQQISETKNQSERLWKNQYPNNINQCPACGFGINFKEVTCPDCGLTLDAEKLPKPTNRTRFNNKDFKYIYMKSKKSK